MLFDPRAEKKTEKAYSSYSEVLTLDILLKVFHR